jgi:hypothetical protein
MFRRTRKVLLLALGIALVAMLLLSAALPELEFLPGLSFPTSAVEDGEGAGGISPELDEAFRTAFRIFTVIVIVGLPFVIVHALLTPEGRKNLLKGMVPIILLGLLLYLALRAGNRLEEQMLPTPTVMPEPAQVTPVPDELLEADVADFAAMDRSAPQWLIWGAIVLLALIIALMLVGMGRFLLRYRTHPPSPLAELADQAEVAAEAIRGGADLRDTVMLCYYRMSQILQEQRGIWREMAMTPREFEGYLTRSGIPGEPVQRLTRLFEKVRYGAHAIGAEDERQALSSLRAIAEYCRGAK